MKEASAPRAQQGRVFQNLLLDRLTKSSPSIILAVYIPLIMAMLAWDVVYKGEPWLRVVSLFLLGVFTWTLAEYFLHRYLFHWVDERPWVQRFHFLAHGYHHTYPRDSTHLFMPPLASIVLALFFYGLFRLVMGTYALAFFPGFMAGYLTYAGMHYSMHTITNPPRYLRGLWRNHQLHHHKNQHQAFGVSSPLWDHVFRTLPR